MAAWCPDCNPWLIAAAVMIPTFMEVLDTSIASVALPHIAGSLSATTDEATWVLTSYLVANAIFLPASGWFSLKFGRRNFLLTCIVIFTVSSLTCGAATSLGMILISRAIQGAGGGALQPLSQAILLESFPQSKRGQAMALFGLGVVVAPVLGPTLGGWLTDAYSWRWAFYINIPIGVAAIWMILQFIKDPPYIKNANPGRIDGVGLGLLAIWLAALQIILDKGQEDDWFGSSLIRWMFALLIVGFVAFLTVELRRKKPLVDLRVFANRNFAFGCLLIGLFGGAIYGIVTLLPLFYQTLMGYTAQAAGIAVSPRGIGALLAMPVIGFLTTRMDTRYMIAGGFLGFSLTTLWMSGADLQMSQWSLTWPIVISGTASGMVFVPLATTAMGTLTNEQIGNASGLFNLLRNVGGSVGISIVNTVVARHQQIHQAELVHDLNQGRLVLTQRIQVLQRVFSETAGPMLSRQRAYGTIQHDLFTQSALWSYIDDFRYLAVVCMCCVPIVFCLKKVKPKAGAVAAH
jgi:DHA2 family multidrug resistance protein